MSDFHRLLQRQIRRHLPDGIEKGPLRPFLEAVHQAYIQFDEDRALLERSLELSSDELSARYKELNRHTQAVERTRRHLEQSLSLLHATLDATCDGILVIDNDQRIVIYNQTFLEMFGLDRQSLKHRNARRLYAKLAAQMRHPDEFERYWQLTRKAPEGAHECLVELRDGRYIDCYSQPRWHQGRIQGRVWSLSDISELKKSEQEARFHSYNDALTELPNRSAFTERLNHALSKSQHDRTELAVIFLDLDGFKYINDTLGIEYGDELLRLAARRISSQIPRHVTVARYGGDEFILMMEGLSNSFDALLLAERLRNTLQQPFRLAEQDVHLTTSIGIALYPTDGKSAETLMRKADMAMYDAKSKGRNNCQFYADELEKLSAHRMQIRHNIRRALKENEFELFYQPKVDLESGQATSVEALIRWRKPGGGWISPAEFIPAAEEYGLIVDIGEWVLEEACRQIHAWEGTPLENLSVAVNISAQHFRKAHLVEHIRERLERYMVPAHQLEIEITESAIMSDLDTTTQILNQLREMGVTTAIDDFGTGYSSLNYLKCLPIDTLKIDKSFIDDLLTDSRNLTLVEAIINIAHTFGIKVVAEGVETLDTVCMLSSYSCDVAQGYYYSRPVPAGELPALVTGQPCPVPNTSPI
ncbi:MAG: EAL domain-containing protein [Gammaproteobacteria bacterium]|nr:MAG: EAL domain-containing protein [Gammaproteobacteria bacterium]